MSGGGPCLLGAAREEEVLKNMGCLRQGTDSGNVQHLDRELEK